MIHRLIGDGAMVPHTTFLVYVALGVTVSWAGRLLPYPRRRPTTSEDSA